MKTSENWEKHQKYLNHEMTEEEATAWERKLDDMSEEETQELFCHCLGQMLRVANNTTVVIL